MTNKLVIYETHATTSSLYKLNISETSSKAFRMRTKPNIGETGDHILKYSFQKILKKDGEERWGGRGGEEGRKDCGA